MLEHVTLRRQAEVERRMGLLTMTTTYIGMAVCLLSTLLSYSSLSVIPRVTPLNAGQTFASNARTEAEKKRAMKRWYHSFKWLILLLYALAMASFVTFMMMCSRVVKIKFHHCDDDFGDLCLVTGSKLGWAPLAAVSFIALYIIVRHIQTKREHESWTRAYLYCGAAAGSEAILSAGRAAHARQVFARV